VRVYVDTNVVIRGLERTDAGAGEVGRLSDLATRGKLALVTSELTLSEVLVAPLRHGDELLAQAYRDFLIEDRVIDLRPVSREVLAASARIRARSGAAFPDAIHLATAILAGCDRVVSYDRRLRDLSDLAVIEPSDAIFAQLDAEPS